MKYVYFAEYEKMIDRIVCIIFICMVITVGLIAWLWNNHPYYVMGWWNRHIKSECDAQDATPLNGIPSYKNAWDSENSSVHDFHRLIFINHEDILHEVKAVLDDPKNQLNLPSSHWAESDESWQPLWVRCMGKWTPTSKLLPTLSHIASLFPDIPGIYVSIFQPGHTVVENKGLSRATQRYHYGLQVPTDDVGLNIGGYDVKWKEREGFVWDNTIPHSAWNHTTEPRIVIFRRYSPRFIGC